MSISGYAISAFSGIDGMSPVLIPGLQEWTAEDSADPLDGATAESEGFDEDEPGLARVRVSMTLVMDIITGSYVPIKRGTLITGLGLFADIEADDPIYNIPKFRVFKSVFMGRIRERVTVQVEGVSVGAFTANDPN